MRSAVVPFALTSTLAIAQGVVQRVDLDFYSVVLYGCVALFSILCGSITYAKSYIKDGPNQNLKLARWFVDAGTAMVSGLTAFFIAVGQNWSVFVAAAMAASVAMGWTSIIDLVRKFGKAP